MPMISLWRRILLKLHACSAVLFRKKVLDGYRARNQVHTRSIISSNCIGGILSSDLHLRFDSPTINLFFEAADFVRFSENLAYYLSLPLKDVRFDPEKQYPIGTLEDIRLYFVHYKTPEECIQKWETRKQRVDLQNLSFLLTDRNGLTDADLRRFLALPYHKIVFVSSPRQLVNSECVLVPGFEKNGQVGEMDKYADWTGHRYYEKYADIIGWLNRETPQ